LLFASNTIEDEVTVGQRIFVYVPSTQKFQYSTVVSVPHPFNLEEGLFLELEFSGGNVLTLTPDHLVLVARGCDSVSSSSMVFESAEQLNIGDCVVSVDGISRLMSKRQVVSYGKYTVVTMEGLPVVDGIVASPFAYNHIIGNGFYYIHRITYFLFPVWSKTLFRPVLQGLILAGESALHIYLSVIKSGGMNYC
jgi:Hint module